MTDKEANEILSAIPPTEVPAPMDVNATLKRLRELAKQEAEMPFTFDQEAEFMRLFNQLDEYLTNGGNTPRDWRPF